MKFLASFLCWSLISSACLGQAYICNLDYHEDISKNSVSMGTTAVFELEHCGLSKKISYEETIGDFKVQIICQNKIIIHVTQKQKTMSIIIEPQEFKKRFLKSHVSGHSGLRISCEERFLGATLVDN